MNTSSILSFDDVVRLVRGLTPAEQLRVVEQIAPDLREGRAVDLADFERLMVEAEADTVAVGRMDDSREAIYARMEGE